MSLDREIRIPFLHGMAAGATVAARDPLYVDAFRPSEYTAALLRTIEIRCAGRVMHRVLDIGVGSGVLLCALARLGAGELWGVDINMNAVDASRDLLLAEVSERRVQILHGDMWGPIPPAMTFDVIVANLPHFPATIPTPGRPLYWCGGQGRGTIDRLLAGLSAHLTPDGVAFITHHELIGTAHTAETLRRHGLAATDAMRWTVFETRERMVGITPATLALDCESLRYYGGYAFVDACILEIRALSGRRPE